MDSCGLPWMNGSRDSPEPQKFHDQHEFYNFHHQEFYYEHEFDNYGEFDDQQEFEYHQEFNYERFDPCQEINYHQRHLSLRTLNQTSQINNNLTNFPEFSPQFELDLETGEAIPAKLTPPTVTRFWIEHEVDEFALKCIRSCHLSSLLQADTQNQKLIQQCVENSDQQLDKSARKRTRRSTRKRTRKSKPQEEQFDEGVILRDNLLEKNQHLPFDHSRSQRIDNARTVIVTEVAVPAEFADAAQDHSSPVLPVNDQMNNELKMTPETSDLMDIMMKMFDLLINNCYHSSVRLLGTPIPHSLISAHLEPCDPTGEVSVPVPLKDAETMVCEADVKKILLENDKNESAALPLDDMDSTVVTHNSDLAVPVPHQRSQILKEFCGLLHIEKTITYNIDCENIGSMTGPNETRKGVG